MMMRIFNGRGISRRPRRVLVIGALILAVVLAAVWLQRSRGAAPATEGMRTTRVVRGTVTSSVSASGTVEPYAKVEVRSRATGTVIAVNVQEGDRVTKGQTLARIDDSDAQAGYETAQANLSASQAKLSQAQLQLQATRAQNLGQVAQAEAALRTAQAQLAQVLAGSRPEEIEQAREALRQAQSSAELARANLERVSTLVTQGFVAKQDLDQAQSEYDVAQAQVRSAQAQLSRLQAGSTAQEIAVARAQVAQAESALATARATGAQEAALAAAVAAAQADSRGNQADLAQALERLGEAQVTAPIDGVVAQLSVQVGQTVIGGASSGGTLLMTLADTRVVQANLAVDEVDIADIRVGTPVRVTVDALPDRTLNGRVSRIAAQSTVTQNVTQFTVVVVIENPDRALRLGMSADGEFILKERRNVLVVPSEAIRGKDTKIVQVVEGERPVPTVVETGVTDGRQVEIIKGLEEGQIVYLGSATGTSTQTSTQQPSNPFMPQPPRR
jgi:HlyD family secretion protein